MLKVKKFVLVNKVLVIVFAFVLLVSAAFAANMAMTEKPAKVNACEFSEKTVYFASYNDRTVVGYEGYRCNGRFVKSGKRTFFSDTLICDCFEDTK